jgi:pimeloyl-ACP methyl ester carboxylesterase
LARLLEAIEAAFELGRAPVHLVGHSFGGTLSRAVAVERPDLIQQVITLGSPLREIVAHPFVVSVAELLESRLPSPDERPRKHGDHFHDGTCSCETIAALARRFPQDVRRTAIYTRQDGIIDWRTAQEEDPKYNVEVSGTHLGLVVNREVYQAIGQLLAAQKSAESTRN